MKEYKIAHLLRSSCKNQCLNSRSSGCQGAQTYLVIPPPTPSLQKNKEKSLERSKLRLRPKSWLMQDLPEEAAAGQEPPPDPLPAGHGEDASD